MSLQNKSKYLLLMRHGAVDRRNFLENEQPLTPEGVDVTTTMAKAANAYLCLLPKREAIEIGQFFYSDYKHSNESAGILLKCLSKVSDADFKRCQDLEPSTFYLDQKAKVEAIRLKIIEVLKEQEGKDKNALMIVGHEPQLSHIAEGFLGPAKGGRVLLDRSEIGCIEIIFKGKSDTVNRRRTNLLWTIAPNDYNSFKAITEKIKSKMDVAKTFSSVIIFLLGFSLPALLDQDKIAFLKGFSKKEWNAASSPANPTEMVNLFGFLTKGIPGAQQLFFYVFLSSILFLFISLVLFLKTVSAYDLLLMPSRFWGNSLTTKKSRWMVSRPPSSSTRVLYLNMMHVWEWMFVPARFFMVSGLLGIAFAVFRFNWVDYLFILSIGYCIYFLYYRIARPQIGSDD